METTRYESWSLDKIAKALKERSVDKINIKIPMFQRNLVWSKDQKKLFIDSVKKGFPIGTLLFFNQKNENTYSLIDGLQRSSTIADFVEDPSKYFGFDDINEDDIRALHELFQSKTDVKEFVKVIKNDIEKFISENDITSAKVINQLSIQLINDYNESMFDPGLVISTGDILASTIDTYNKKISDMKNAIMPVMIFSGNESDLPTVFERINNQGTQLGKYQIYAASWAVNNVSVKVDNEEIIKYITDKYDDFQSEGFVIQDYDKDEIVESKEISIFEYALGFGKYISEKYENLFTKDKNIQDINQAGFELLNACFGRPNKDIKNLNLLLEKVEINKLEKRVLEIIDYVNLILNPYIAFKGNSRNSNTLFHAQNQIISIIATTFREKNDMEDLNHEKVSWKKNEKKLRVNIPQHYVFDIIAKNWAEGGFGKIYADIRENKYLIGIDKEMWEAKLEDWFSTLSAREEKVSVASPKSTEKLFLNCIYVKIFSAKDQLSMKKFDIEHIATKDLIKNAIKQNEWDGLAISSIGNLCYLPEYDNRAKGPKTIYQDKKYLDYLATVKIPISDIEEKYTFTNESMLEWINEKYTKNDYGKFKSYYTQFLRKRFDMMKEKFYESLCIQ